MCLHQSLRAQISRKTFLTGLCVSVRVTCSCSSHSHLVEELDVHPAPVCGPEVERADAADGEALQHGEPAAASLALRQLAGPLPPLVVLLEQVEGLPGRQDGQRLPDVV